MVLRYFQCPFQNLSFEFVGSRRAGACKQEGFIGLFKSIWCVIFHFYFCYSISMCFQFQKPTDIGKQTGQCLQARGVYWFLKAFVVLSLKYFFHSISVCFQIERKTYFDFVGRPTGIGKPTGRCLPMSGRLLASKTRRPTI